MSKPHSIDQHQVELLHDGDDCFDSMLNAIALAKTEILLEMYWFASDTVGLKFKNALCDAALKGVRVMVTYDAVGSVEADNAMFADMEKAGILLLQYHPIAPWRSRFRLTSVNRRNHRKILIVDQNIGFTGGINLGDEWLSIHRGGHGWRDDMIRIEGQAVRKLRRVFMDTWNQYVPSLAIKEPPTPPQNRKIKVLANQSFGDRYNIRKTYMIRIAQAQHRIFITNSYFLPDRGIYRRLMKAAKRGVDVRLLVPHQSDVPAVDYARGRLYTKLLKAGIQIYEWNRSILHSKTAVIDTWSIVGSYNLDFRSWLYSLEVAVSVKDQAFSDALSQKFQEDIAASMPVDPLAWKKRPWAVRVLEWFFYLFRKLL